MRKKVLGVGAVCAVAFTGAAGYAVLGSEEPSSAAAPQAKAEIAGWRWAPDDELPHAAKPDPDTADDATAADSAADADAGAGDLPHKDPKPTQPATSSSRADVDDNLVSGNVDNRGDVLVKAEVLKNGVALPPLEAPPEVRAIFEAGNTIARSPYKWGGGHGKWRDNGYDCSGSVSYALAAAGFLNAPLASGPLMHWGAPGKGKWITIYANEGHVWMVVAGVRFDTVARGQTGSRWINDMTSTDGYVARHPPGF